jgi:hypothetical protein
MMPATSADRCQALYVRLITIPVPKIARHAGKGAASNTRYQAASRFSSGFRESFLPQPIRSLSGIAGGIEYRPAILLRNFQPVVDVAG